MLLILVMFFNIINGIAGQIIQHSILYQCFGKDAKYLFLSVLCQYRVAHSF
jgi:hypothetical protein